MDLAKLGVHEEGGTAASASAPLRLVALGASAGGLAAFERFFRAVDQPTGFAFVVVQHLSPEHESILPQLLAAFTRMTVAPVADDTRPLPDHVYVIPPNATLIFREGRLRLATLEPRASRQPISAFFSSLAEELGPAAVAVVLSGTGSDGAAGLHAVRARGGLTLVQSPSEAQYDSMPRSAVATGDVDMVLPAADMPEMILREVRRRAAGAGAETAAVQDDPLAAITGALRRHTGKEFGSFKRTTLLRRVRRRLTATGLTSLGDYLARVEVDGAEAATLAADLMIGVTRFFRDRPAFEALAARALPRLFEFSGDQAVRVWVPGCSTGEEAYSIAIQLAAAARAAGAPPPSGLARFQIFATDINETALATARVGHYPSSIAADVPPEWLSGYFTPEDGGYTVTREIRDACIFSIHDVVRDPPFSKIDLVSCRNLLIYIDPATQARLLPLFHYALRPSGFLFLGSSETVGDLSGLFDAVDQKHRLFRRSAGTGVRVQFPLTVALAEPRPRRAPAAEGGDGGPAAGEPLRALTAGFLEELSTAVALVDGRGVARYFAGPVSRFLPTPTGAPSTNVLELATGDLQLELTAALQAATAGGRIRRQLTLGAGPEARHLELTVKPHRAPGGPRDAYLVLLRELEPSARAPAAGEADQRTHQLEAELHVATDRWRRAVQDLESTNEELRSANEELQTMNEELQSSNEELQLSQEELQSVNEELNTVNTELGTKAEEVNALYADLQNLFQSTRIATVVLDRELCVTRFTPAATRLFPLAAADLGRPLQDLAAPFAGPSVLADARAVLEDLTARERLVELEDGSGWHLLRVLPYLSLGRAVEGVVLTFADVTELKRAEQALRESEGRHRASLESLLDAFGVFRPVLGSDGHPVDFEIRYLNAPAARLLRAAEPRPRLRELVAQGSPLLAILEKALALAAAVEHHDAAGVGAAAGRFFDLRASPLGGEVVVAWRDVTDRTRATEALRETDRRKDEFLAVLGHELRNPLAALQTALHLEQRARAPGADGRHLELMRRQLGSLGRLVDDLLDVARISRGKVQLRLASVDLVDAARAAVAAHEQAAAGRIALEVRAPGGPVWARGDAERIAQMAGNLVGNACKFTEDGGLVEVEVTAAEDGGPALVVRDHGLGMSEETLAHLFEPFRQAKHGPERARGGLGLGLWLVKGLAGLMDAEITARSEGLGRGAEFRVRFQPAPPLEVPAAPPASGAAAEGGGRPLRILVVDDNPDVRETLVEYLTVLRGHEVGSAEDCEGGLARAEAWRPQVVLCDIGLPRVSGHEFARRARQGGALRDTVLVALTGYGTDADRLRSQAAGFDHHLTKPLDLGELDRFLQDVAARGRSAPSLRPGQAASRPE